MKALAIMSLGFMLGAAGAFVAAPDIEVEISVADGAVGWREDVAYSGIELCEGSWPEQERCLRQNGLDSEPTPWQPEAPRF